MKTLKKLNKSVIKIGDKVKVTRYGFITSVRKIEKSHFVDNKNVYVLENGIFCHIEEIQKLK